jgi:hypothetical protein
MVRGPLCGRDVYGLVAVSERTAYLDAESRPESPGTAVDGQAGTRPSRLALGTAIVLVLLAIAPVIAVLVTRTGHHYVPAGDMGLIDMRVRDVLSAHPPLVGPYSRYGWSHPGPLMFWMLAIPSALFGQPAWATLVGSAVLQAVAIVWLALLAWRRGGLPLLAGAMVAMSLIYVTTGAWVVLEPWNPHVALPFFALFIFQAWLFATGEYRVLLGAAISSIFLVQTHVGYAPLVAIVAAVAALYAFIDLRRGRTDAVLLRSRIPRTVIVVVLLWLPAIIEMAQNPPGNLARLARYFLRSNSVEPAIGLRAGAQLLAAEFRWPPSWLGGSDFFDPLTHRSLGGSLLQLLVPVGLLVVGFTIAYRSRRADSERFLVMAAALLVASPFVLAKVTGVPYPYLFYWRPVVAIAVVLGVVAAIWAMRPRSAQAKGAAAIVAIGLVAFGSGSIGVDVLTHDRAVSTYEDATSSIARQLRRHGTPPRGVILRIDQNSLIALQRGIFDELDRAGRPVYADSELGFEFGNNRARSVSDVDVVWWVADRGSIASYLSNLPNASLIAYSTPLDAADEAEARRLQAELLRQLAAADRMDLAPELDDELVAFALGGVPGLDQTAVGRLGDLNAKVERSRTCRCGVVALPSRAAPTEAPW